MAVGHRPLANTTGAMATLRRCLMELDVSRARKYRTHDIRRGQAADLRKGGASLYEILSAGEWSSRAWLRYLDLQELETGVVLEAHVDESSSGGGDQVQDDV
jgi:hypothetical protein